MKVVIAGNEIIVKSELLEDEISFVFREKKQAETVFPIVKRVVDFALKQDMELIIRCEDLLGLPEVYEDGNV